MIIRWPAGITITLAGDTRETLLAAADRLALVLRNLPEEDLALFLQPFERPTEFEAADDESKGKVN